MTVLLKFWPYIAGVLFVLACGTYLYHSGEVKGRAEVQATFDKFVRASDAVVAQQKAENEAKAIKVEKDNAAIIQDYQDKLGTSRALAGELAIRLRDYLAKAGSSPMPPTPSGSGPSGASPEAGNDAVGEALALTFAECRANADELDALIAEVKSQL